MTLTKEQEQFVRDNSAKILDLNELTRQCFDNPALDGRKKEGRAVRKFLIDNGIEYSTTRIEKKEQTTFTPQQEEFILQQAEEGLSSLKIARILFPNKEVKPLSLDQRAVLEVIQKANPDFVPSQQSGESLSDYTPPKAISRIVKKINDATGLNLNEDKLNRQHQICVDKLGINLSNSRFVIIANNYLKKDHRELFEHEFIRLTWDKPDLTADEINLYLNVCKEIINLEVISANLNKLNEMFDDVDDQQEMSVRLAEIIKAKSSEYHQCETRIENLTKKLQGDRGERLKNKHKENASILSLVQLFQDYEERANMVRMADMQAALVEKEAHRLEGLPEWKARVLGITIEDVL